MAERLIIIDGYNVIHRSPSLRPSEDRTLAQSREKLISLLAWAVGGGEAQFLVVFDGAEGVWPDERTSRVEVMFSRPPKTADDVIRGLVEARVDRVERVTVVTSDLEVARHARGIGADIALSDLFLASILPPKPSEPGEKPVTLSKREVEQWAEIFRAPRPGDGRRVNGETDEPAPDS